MIHELKNEPKRLPIIVVGTGPVGIRALEEILKVDSKVPVLIFGDEPWRPYDRIQLSSLLAGEIAEEKIFSDYRLDNSASVIQYHNRPIIKINRERRQVTDAENKNYSYSKLVLAVGSRPHIPNIAGVHLTGVYTFRNMNDALSLSARQFRTRKTVVIGGGLLGLEAARAMQKNNTEVFVIEHMPRLMHQQLDTRSAELLREHLMSLGIKVILSSSVQQILGELSVTGVVLRDERIIECDTVIVATGIKPNIQLALDSKLAVGRGIRVDDTLKTNDPDIYAVGECVEHNNITYGLVAPGYEQASVAASNILGNQAIYHGSQSITKLKILKQPVFSIGIVTENEITTSDISYTFEDSSKQIYRKIVLRGHRIIGALAIGEWDAHQRLSEAVRSSRRVWPWQTRNFSRTGELWPDAQANDVSRWPATAIVCACTGTTRGQLTAKIAGGCRDLESLQRETRVSTVCGSCKPLVMTMCGAPSNVTPHVAYGIFAFLAAIILLFVFVNLLPYNYPQSNSVQTWNVANLWTDSITKQNSGYTLLAIILITSIFLSLRKRWRRFKVSELGQWRIVHTVAGLISLVILFSHTGFRVGENLNAWLMLCFLGAAAIGSVIAFINAFEHLWSPRRAKRWRSIANFAHILILWPFPVLVGFHITSVYFF